jgi:hypothetical protein
MGKMIENIGNAAAATGIVLCAVSGVARIAGMYHLGHYQAMTLFTGGMGLMLMGALCKLHALGNESK